MHTWIRKTTRTSKVFSHKIIESENHHEVASIYRKCDDAEEAKNASLISAAPDMFAALTAIVNEWRNNDPQAFKSDLATDALNALANATP
jgi:hypothetical protein